MKTTRQVRQVKACDCSATASGPRLKILPMQPGGVVRIMLLPFACDRCDLPWTETSEFVEQPREH